MAHVLLDDVFEASFALRSASTRVPTVEPRGETPPILVCRGPHAGACMLLARHGITGLDGGDHGLVVEADLSIPDHRNTLRTLRSSLSQGTALVVLARAGLGNAAAC